MKVPFSWLKEYVDIDVTAQELEDKLFGCGFEVEELIDLSAEIDRVVVGVVKECTPVEGTHLYTCKVDCGEYGNDIQIVTGAPNVYAGMHTPAALDNSTLPGGIKIKAKPMRGIESNGMLCSGEELGLNDDLYPGAEVYGLLDLPKDTVPGTDIAKVVGLDDYIFDISVTANRADCQSVLGIAREVAAVLDKPLKMPALDYKQSDYKYENLDIKVEAQDLCPRYLGHGVRNITPGQSPRWMRRHLALCGLRSISNVVDITNYVMLEIGQPMHAFSIETIKDSHIIVRNAKEGETITTLDGQERSLDPSMLVIADPEKAVAIAGVMGGENSMIVEGSQAVLFESANFDGPNVRITAKKVGLRTDASSKFEKGLDPNLALEAVNRAVQLVELLEGGEVVPGVVDEYPNKREPWQLSYNPAWINKFLGTSISEEEMQKIFEKIELKVDPVNHIVTIPTFRPDLEAQADLAEEIARFYGYNKIEATLASGTPTVGKRTYAQSITALVKDTVIANGLCEAMTYSFESPKVFDKLLIPADSDLRKAIVISNPLGEDFSIMRTVSFNGILTSLATNYNRRNESAGLFEVAKVYIPKALPLTELPHEIPTLTMGMYGNMDFYDLKGIVEHLMHVLGMSKVAEYVTEKALPWMHPGRTASVIVNGESIGYLGEVHPAVLKNYGIGTRAYLAVLDMEKVIANANRDVVYQALPKFPALTRDIAMLVKEDVTVKEIADIIKKNGGAYLEEAKLFDVYQGAQIEAGYKSVAYSITFRSAEKTLADADIADAMDKILKGLAEELGAQLRDK